MNEFLTCSFALDLTSTEVESATLTAKWALDFGGHFRIYMWPVACLLWWRNLVCVAMRSDFSSCLQQVCQPIFLLMWWLKETGSTTLATPSFRCFLVWDELLWSQFVEGFCRDRSSPNSMTWCFLLVLPRFQHCQRLYEVAIFFPVFPIFNRNRFFVVMLLIMAPLAEPLRQALRTREKDGAKDGSTQLFTIFWGTVSAGGLGILRPRLYRWHGYRDSDPRKRFEMDPALCSGAATYTTDSGACGWDAVPEPVGCYGVPGWEYRNDRLGLAGLFLYADAGDSLG